MQMEGGWDRFEPALVELWTKRRRGDHTKTGLLFKLHYDNTETIFLLTPSSAETQSSSGSFLFAPDVGEKSWAVTQINVFFN